MWGCSMKKFLILLILPLVAVVALFGCGENRTIDDVKQLYIATTQEHIVEKENIFFSDTDNPLMIKIAYPTSLLEVIEAEGPTNDLQKRCRGLYYQQKILDYIFDYYENNQEDFYRLAVSNDFDKDKVNLLYDKLANLNETLDNFLSDYNSFNTKAKEDVSEIKEYNITSYSYQLNKVIDASFSFMFLFHDMYVECLEDYNEYSVKNLQIYLDKAYLDKAYMIYLENIKAFNYSVGENGVCDMAKVIGNDTEYNLLELLNDKKLLSVDITDNLNADAVNYDKTMSIINEFVYSRNVFSQKINSYLITYNNLDVYTISSYKFNTINGVGYDSYINSQNASNKANILMLENFVEGSFMNYMEKLNKITN